MHALVEWKLYDTCGVHHVTSKDKEIFLLVEKDYPLRKGLAIGMISYKLQVKNYSRMANDLILKIYKIAKDIPTGSDEFPLPEQLPTANEDKFPLLIQSDATAVKLALLLKSRNNYPIQRNISKEVVGMEKGYYPLDFEGFAGEKGGGKVYVNLAGRKSAQCSAQCYDVMNGAG
nr:hypothetical protein [Tanacetum cinerariifolium]